MPLGAKTIRTRIRSVKNTGKITKAMELISANKMRKASRFAEGGRSYDSSISEIMKIINVEEDNKENKREIKKIAVVLFSGNRGLCGSFNSQIISFARKSALEKMKNTNTEVVWIPIGKKGAEALARSGQKIEAEFKKIESGEESSEFFNIGRYLSEEFNKGHFDQVWLSYTDFVTSLKQIPRFNLLLPIKSSASAELRRDKEFLFEPNKEELLSFLIPRYIETRLYQALLESNASEHSSRMIAMKNASDACKEITDELTFLGNELRQAGITREIIEIAGAKAAIE